MNNHEMPASGPNEDVKAKMLKFMKENYAASLGEDAQLLETEEGREELARKLDKEIWNKNPEDKEVQ